MTSIYEGAEAEGGGARRRRWRNNKNKKEKEEEERGGRRRTRTGRRTIDRDSYISLTDSLPFPDAIERCTPAYSETNIEGTRVTKHRA